MKIKCYRCNMPAVALVVIKYRANVPSQYMCNKHCAYVCEMLRDFRGPDVRIADLLDIRVLAKS